MLLIFWTDLSELLLEEIDHDKKNIYSPGCRIYGCGSVHYFTPTESRVKNIILVIGDSMGAREIGFFNSYVKYAPESVYRKSGRTSSLERIMREGRGGLIFTKPSGGLVTDSAAASTMLATGKFSRNGMIGADYRGNRMTTLLEKAEEAGMATGLVSDTRITHATPAGFASHRPERSMENEIAVDLLNSGVDVMLSGGSGTGFPVK